MQIRAAAVALCLLFVAGRAEAQFGAPPAPAGGEQFNLEVGLMFWYPTPELRVQTDGLAAVGVPEVDFVQEFGLETEMFMEFRSVLKLGRKNKIRVSYLPIEYTSQTTLQRDITFGGVTYPISVPVDMNFKMDIWRFGYEYDFVAADRGVLGLITELKRSQLTAGLEAPGFGRQVTDVTAPIMALGGILRLYPHRNIAITTEFTGFKVFGFVKNITDAIAEDLDVEMYDLDIYGTFNFGRHVGAQVGYRRISANYLVEADTGDMVFKGLYFGGVARF
jgi:hypothetical protein